MLDPWIIEQIRRREDERRREQDARYVELPLYEDLREEPVRQEENNEPKRGVVVMDM